MRSRLKVSLLLIGAWTIGSLQLAAQDSLALSEASFVAKRQIEAMHDNDFPFSTDYYYTTGSFIRYRHQLKRGVVPGTKEQLAYTVVQQFYTPSEVKETNVRRFDRPYAGFLGASIARTTATVDRLLHLELLVGVAGSNSGAEGFQRLFHSSGGLGTPQWIDQIDNSIHGNIYIDYTREWKLGQRPRSFILAWSPELAVGTKDIYAQNDVVLFFGKRNPLQNSVAYQQLGPLQRELFCSVRVGQRWVMHNAMLEGNLIRDESVFTIDATPQVFRAGFDVYFRYHRNDYRLGYNYATKETPKATGHQYVTISIARNY